MLYTHTRTYYAHTFSGRQSRAGRPLPHAAAQHKFCMCNACGYDVYIQFAGMMGVCILHIPPPPSLCGGGVWEHAQHHSAFSGRSGAPPGLGQVGRRQTVLATEVAEAAFTAAHPRAVARIAFGVEDSIVNLASIGTDFILIQLLVTQPPELPVT
jgi:hypothetical protein